MAEKYDTINRSIQAYIRELKKTVTVERAYLFGSRAYGRHRAGSDIDLAIISPDAEDAGRHFKVYAALSVAALRTDPRIEAVIFSPRDMSRITPGSLAGEILRKGRLVYQAQKNKGDRRDTS